jgi:hypothetical protein
VSDNRREFIGWPKIARLSREIIVTEKLDGTNAAVVILEDGDIYAQSRTRVIVPGDDNFGFAAWVEANKAELLKLGPGRHFGEWWGRGIQRNYGLTERRFSLFNVSRWGDPAVRPACCHVVPTLYRDLFDTASIQVVLNTLRVYGSHAAPGFMNPEGIIAFHTAANTMFKKTLDKDDEPKGK